MLNRNSGKRNLSKALFFSIVFSLLLLPFQNAAAQVTEDETGVYASIGLMASSMHIDETDKPFIEDDGGGLQLDLGYRFNPTFALGMSLGLADHETTEPGIDALFSIFQILAFYRFCPERPFRPYIKGGIGGYGLTVTEGSSSINISGGGVVIGGGFRFFFSSHFAIGLDMAHNIINYERGKLTIDSFSVETEIDEQGSQTSLALSFNYSF